MQLGETIAGTIMKDGKFNTLIRKCFISKLKRS